MAGTTCGIGSHQKCVQGYGNGFTNTDEQQFLGTRCRKQCDHLYTSGSSKPAGLNGVIFAHPTPYRRDTYLCLETFLIVMTGEELLASSGQRPMHMAMSTARNYAVQIVQSVMIERHPDSGFHKSPVPIRVPGIQWTYNPSFLNKWVCEKMYLYYGNVSMAWWDYWRFLFSSFICIFKILHYKFLIAYLMKNFI